MISTGARAFASVAKWLVFTCAATMCASCTDSQKKPPGAADANAASPVDATAPVTRIVSLSPSTTETLFAIGAGGAVVGRSRYCDYPDEVKKLPQVGGYVDPNLEAILALKPELVTGARGPQGRSLVDVLEARGIVTYFPETESFAEIDSMIEGLGARTNHAAEARAVIATIHREVSEVETDAKTKSRARVLLVFGIRPVVVAGPNGFPSEMIARANGENAVKQGGGYPTLSIETVASLDPDIIINAAIAESHGAEPITKDAPGWSSVRAVREGHVVQIADESVLRPGPRIGTGLKILSRAIHGGT